MSILHDPTDPEATSSYQQEAALCLWELLVKGRVPYCNPDREDCGQRWEPIFERHGTVRLRLWCRDVGGPWVHDVYRLVPEGLWEEAGFDCFDWDRVPYIEQWMWDRPDGAEWDPIRFFLPNAYSTAVKIANDLRARAADRERKTAEEELEATIRRAQEALLDLNTHLHTLSKKDN